MPFLVTSLAKNGESGATSPSRLSPDQSCLELALLDGEGAIVHPPSKSRNWHVVLPKRLGKQRQGFSMNATPNPDEFHAQQLPLAYRLYAPLNHLLTALGPVKVLGRHPSIVIRNRLNRFLFRNVFTKDETTTVLTKEGFQIAIPLNDQAAASILFEHEYSPHEARMVKNLIQHSSSFTDVGANLGYFSLLVLTHSTEPYRVVSVDPNASLCELIRKSMQLNGMPDKNVIQAAVGESPGRVQFQVDPQCSSIAKVLGANASVDAENSVDVVTLDDIVPRNGGEKPPLVKIDVEGYEIQVLAGAKRLLHDGAILLCEVSGPTAPELSKLAKELGYEAFDHSGNVCPLDQIGPHTRTDVVLVPSSAARAIQAVLQNP